MVAKSFLTFRLYLDGETPLMLRHRGEVSHEILVMSKLVVWGKSGKKLKAETMRFKRF